MRVIAGSAFAAPSQQRLQEFQKDNGIALPPDYLAFLRRNNCVRLATPAFHDGKRERSVVRMLGLLDDHRAHGTAGFADIEVVISQIGTRLVSDPMSPYATLIPFAELFAGDFVCFDYRRVPFAPPIAIWDHERSDDFRPFAETVAPNFSAFAQMLYEPETVAVEGFAANS